METRTYNDDSHITINNSGDVRHNNDHNINHADDIQSIIAKMDILKRTGATFYPPDILQARNTLYRSLNDSLQLLTGYL